MLFYSGVSVSLLRFLYSPLLHGGMAVITAQGAPGQKKSCWAPVEHPHSSFIIQPQAGDTRYCESVSTVLNLFIFLALCTYF